MSIFNWRTPKCSLCNQKAKKVVCMVCGNNPEKRKLCDYCKQTGYKYWCTNCLRIVK